MQHKIRAAGHSSLAKKGEQRHDISGKALDGNNGLDMAAREAKGRGIEGGGGGR